MSSSLKENIFQRYISRREFFSLWQILKHISRLPFFVSKQFLAKITCKNYLQKLLAKITCKNYLQKLLAKITCKKYLQKSLATSASRGQPYPLGEDRRDKLLWSGTHLKMRDCQRMWSGLIVKMKDYHWKYKVRLIPLLMWAWVDSAAVSIFVVSYIGWIDKFCICRFNQYIYKYLDSSAV